MEKEPKYVPSSEEVKKADEKILIQKFYELGGEKLRQLRKQKPEKEELIDNFLYCETDLKSIAQELFLLERIRNRFHDNKEVCAFLEIEENQLLSTKENLEKSQNELVHKIDEDIIEYKGYKIIPEYRYTESYSVEDVEDAKSMGKSIIPKEEGKLWYGTGYREEIVPGHYMFDIVSPSGEKLGLPYVGELPDDLDGVYEIAKKQIDKIIEKNK